MPTVVSFNSFHVFSQTQTVALTGLGSVMIGRPPVKSHSAKLQASSIHCLPDHIHNVHCYIKAELNWISSSCALFSQVLLEKSTKAVTEKKGNPSAESTVYMNIYSANR